MNRTEAEALIGRYLDAFNKGDVDGMLACLHEDIVHDINQGGREIGRDRFRWFMATMNRHYREALSDIVVMVDENGRRAAAEFTVRGTYLETAEGLPPAGGQSYSLPAGIFFEIDDGLISRVTTYYNLSDWIAQVEKG
ncbi:ketosteroid isomerase-related protein [Mesorhizobium sp. Z1-4]|uniref:ketosteroid isomerase-related protein n=1 Tax=Mesorhizobium sp. Z1-4 TaxID=2448478 RepID=UPI000FDB0A91|nr:ketosteroid isomerase-related protein [Mesorhizobium sp. Z1-4]